MPQPDTAAESRDYNLGWLRSYVAQVQPLLQLGHWQIEVLDEPSVEDQFEWSLYGRTKRAELRVADRFFDLGEAKQRIIIVAALLHLALPVLSLTYCRQFEETVQALARIIAPDLPRLG